MEYDHPSDILPSELWDHIFLFVLRVSPSTLRSVMASCKFFFATIDNNHFWRQAYLSTHPDKIDDSPKSWKQKFILEFGGISVRFGGMIENGAGSCMYITCPSLQNQIVQTPHELVAAHKIVKRGNPFCIPLASKDFPSLELSFYLAQSKDAEESVDLLHSTPLFRCCDICPSNMVSFRTYGFQFDSEGKAQIPLVIHCAPTHDRRRGKQKILLHVKIGKRSSAAIPLQFKTGKRMRKECQIMEVQGPTKYQA